MVTHGLTSHEAQELKLRFGDNKLSQKKDYSVLSILIAQFINPLILILVFAAIIPLYFQDYFEVVLIGSVVFLNAAMGFYQEYSAHRTLAALQQIVRAEAIVLRDGRRQSLNVEDLVPGDIVVLGAGDRVPADGKLVDGIPLSISEAILTGEEEPVEKSFAKEKNHVFMGTTVIAGSALMEVLKIGTQTEIGKIGVSLGEIKDEETPLQKKLSQFARTLVLAISFISLLIFAAGTIFYQKNAIAMLQIAVILAVAAVPEGLPIAITVVMARGMARILKKKGLVKRLVSIETLGSTSVICTDKTGTLTYGQMKVAKSEFVDLKTAATALILANNQRTNLELSLWDFAKENGFSPQEIFNANPRQFEVPFNSASKYSLMVNEVEGEKHAYMLGAPEIVMNFCELPESQKAQILERIENWSQEGLKVLSAAWKTQGDLKTPSNFEWLGLVGIKDSVRDEVKETIFRAQKAGIKIKIVTGDFVKTAESVASQAGLQFENTEVMTGDDFKIESDALRLKILQSVIFARVTPAQKLKIVKVLQGDGEVVAMTGDGVNDALALKKADIGVVVNNASEVAKESADLVILDSNLKTVVAAVEEGRIVFSNIKKLVAYVLSNSFAEIVLIVGAMMLNLPAPLTVVQILWLHLICDGPPDVTLAFEPSEKDIMKRMPVEIKREQIIGAQSKFIIGGVSLFMGLSSLAVFYWIWHTQHDLILAQTVAFITLGIVDLVYVFSFKNLERSLFKSGNLFNNKYLLMGDLYGFVLIFAAIYVPFFNSLLHTVPLSLNVWLLAFGVGVATTMFVEMTKLVFRKPR